MKMPRPTAPATRAGEAGAPLTPQVPTLRSAHQPSLGMRPRRDAWHESGRASRRSAWLGLALLFFVGQVFQAPAQLHPLSTWTGAGGNNRWDNPANWNPSGAPDANGIATINSGSPDATVVGAASVYQVNLNGGTLTSSGLTIQILNQAGGALLARTYFHLVDEHSRRMAARVRI